jgi:hypothetical protein
VLTITDIFCGGAPVTHTFRALWPITNPHIPFTTLCEQATQDLPLLTAQAKARIRPRDGRWSIARSVDTPGSGRTTTWCLIYEAPAKPRKPHTTPTLDRSNAA